MTKSFVFLQTENSTLDLKPGVTRAQGIRQRIDLNTFSYQLYSTLEPSISLCGHSPQVTLCCFHCWHQGLYSLLCCSVLYVDLPLPIFNKLTPGFFLGKIEKATAPRDTTWSFLFSLARFSLEKSGVPMFCTSKLQFEWKFLLLLSSALLEASWSKGRMNWFVSLKRQAGTHTFWNKKETDGVNTIYAQTQKQYSPKSHFISARIWKSPLTCWFLFQQREQFVRASTNPLHQTAQVTFVSLCVPNTSQITSYADTHL